jgi:hypothetical protein
MKARARATVSSGRRSLLGPAGVILYVGFPLITLPGRPRLWLWRQSLSLRLFGAAKLSRGNFCCRGNFRKFRILPLPEWNVTSSSAPRDRAPRTWRPLLVWPPGHWRAARNDNPIRARLEAPLPVSALPRRARAAPLLPRAAADGARVFSCHGDCTVQYCSCCLAASGSQTLSAVCCLPNAGSCSLSKTLGNEPQRRCPAWDSPRGVQQLCTSFGSRERRGPLRVCTCAHVQPGRSPGRRTASPGVARRAA